MKIIKNSLAGIVGGAVVAVLVMGLGYTFQKPVEISEGIKGAQGEQGMRGMTGTQGIQGPIGLQGPMGLQGVAGKDAIVNIKTLTDAVVDEIKVREDDFKVTLTGNAGNANKNLNIVDAGSYLFTINNYSSGDFDVSLEDADGHVIVLVNTTGHYSNELSRSLSDEQYIVHVSSEGSWTVKVEQQ